MMYKIQDDLYLLKKIITADKINQENESFLKSLYNSDTIYFNDGKALFLQKIDILEYEQVKSDQRPCDPTED